MKDAFRHSLVGFGSFGASVSFLRSLGKLNFCMEDQLTYQELA